MIFMKKAESDLNACIEEDLERLSTALAKRSTIEVAQCCFSEFIALSSDRKDGETLMSPARQISLLLSVLAGTPEPASPEELGSGNWQEIKRILNRLFLAYYQLYLPEEAGEERESKEWIKSRQVSMLAFFHYFNTDLLASSEQLVKRIKVYLSPFDKQIQKLLGIGVNEGLVILKWVADSLQESADALIRASNAMNASLMKEAEQQADPQSYMKDAAQRAEDIAIATDLYKALNRIGTISLSELKTQFPESGEAFCSCFVAARGMEKKVKYPTDQGILSKKPLIAIPEDRAASSLPNAIYSAFIVRAQSALARSKVFDSYRIARDNALEKEAVELFSKLIGENASIYQGAYETPDSQHEHDVIICHERICLVVESKASPPKEPFRDPKRAFLRLRDGFRSDVGLQKAYDQSQGLVDRLRRGERVKLFDKRGTIIAEVSVKKGVPVIPICFTRDSFGPLATNLSLLLKANPRVGYPWAISSFDLQNFVDAWLYFDLGIDNLAKFLVERVRLHGKAFSDDELDYAGFYLRHGGFESIFRIEADLVQLGTDYSDVFDLVYQHLYQGGPAIEITRSDPVLFNLSEALKRGENLVLPSKSVQKKSERKVGRNERCPCGSGRKFKKCCGAIRHPRRQKTDTHS